MLYIIGDTHYNFDSLKPVVSYDINRTVIHVGDFGLYKAKLDIIKELNQYYADGESHLYVCRGNHDDPRLFNELQLSNIHFVKDNSIIELDGKRIYFNGGAISIDRSMNTEYSGPDENFYYESGSIDLSNIDVVITHTFKEPFKGNIVNSWASNELDIQKNIKDYIKEYGHTKYGYIGAPSTRHFFELTLKNKFKLNLKKELDYEQSLIDRLIADVAKANPDKMIDWFYGHYHPFDVIGKRHEIGSCLIDSYCLPISHVYQLK